MHEEQVQRPVGFDQMVWDKEVWINLSDLTQNLRVFLSYASVQQNVPSEEEVSIIQETSCSNLSMLISLFSRVPVVLTQQAHLKSGQGGIRRL